jgi:predicted secreted hydrolase
MIFLLRRKDGTIDSHSAGTYIDRQGRARHLTQADFSLTPLDTWRSSQTGASYPVHWRIQVPSLEITLNISATYKAQELVSKESNGPNYWEGAVTYSGSRTGVGYLEMTGYDKPISFE